MSTLKQRLQRTLLTLSLASFACAPVLADDTEIFFGSGSVASSVKPNVLFIIDDSGSMSATVSGTSPAKSRLQVVREAFFQIMEESNNINVGLMNFSGPDNSTNGGPILYPVRFIDELAPAEFLREVSENASDAHQPTGGTLTYSTQSIRLGDQVNTVSGTQIRDVQAANDVKKRTTAGGSTLLLGDGSDYVGLRFSGMNIPAGANIISANLRVTLAPLNNGDANAAGQLVFVERDDTNPRNNPDDYAGTGNVSSRSRYGNYVEWNNIPTQAAGTINTNIQSPNLAPLVQTLVNRTDWTPGNAIALNLQAKSGADGNRDIHGWSSTAGYRPQLTVTWSTGPSTGFAGLRFSNVQIPQGATISRAWLEVVPYGPSIGTTTLNIRAHNTDNSADFATTDLQSRTLTTASANWTVGDWNSANTTEISSDISPVIQEVVGRAGWCGGNALSVVITGTGDRFIQAKENGSQPARLMVEYTGNAGATTGCYNTTNSEQISSGSADVEQIATTGVVISSEQNLDTYQVRGTPTTVNSIGLLFTDVKLPDNVDIYSISSATLTLTAQNSRVATNASFTIRGVLDAGLSALPAGVNGISTLPMTSASMGCTLSAWTANTAYVCTGVGPVINEIIQHSSWSGAAGGNNLPLVIIGSGGDLALKSYELSPGESARLSISYSGRYTSTTASRVRGLLQNKANLLTPASWTPTSGVLSEAASYYRGGAVRFGRQRGNTQTDSDYHISHPSSWTGGTHVLPTGCPSTNSTVAACKDEAITGSPVYISPIEQVCQTNNHIVFLSDGEPNSNATTSGKPYNSTPSIIQSITSQTCDTANDGKDCAIKLATYIKNNDQASWLTGDQTITTHTIGFAQNIPFLQDLATAGGGIFKQANNSNELVAAFKEILANVSKVNTTFVSAGVSVNQFNRLTHSDKLYFALFEPATNVAWQGNLKKYSFQNGRIVDVNNTSAIDPSTNKFYDESKSYWSTAADGNSTSEGGAANLLTPSTRRIFTDVTAAAITSSANELVKTNANLYSYLGIASSSERDKTVDWARGYDVDSASPTAPRYSMGDPLHSQPVVMEYASGVTAVVYMSDNQGFLHAFNASTGAELWSFIPKEKLANLYSYRLNSPGKLYGLDGPISVALKNDVNNNGIVDTGDTAYMIVGMGRGGRNYYVFDISSQSTPVLMYTIQGGSGAFSRLGLTTSKPEPARVKLNGTNYGVWIFGGGYDASEDGAATPSGGSLGNDIFMVNVLNGSVVWHKDNATNTPASGIGDISGGASTMTHAIPSRLSILDLTGSGYAEVIYASDVRGQVFRLDVNNSSTSVGNLVTGGRIAAFGGSTAADNRRFFATPNVAVVHRSGSASYVSVAIGSGWREHPKDLATDDKFYIIRDTGALLKEFHFDATPTQMLDITGITDGKVGTQTVSEYLDANTLRGWYLDFNTTGEKVVTSALTFAGKVVFSSYLPATSGLPCDPSEGTSRTYFLDVFDGKAVLNNTRYIDDTTPGLGADPMLYESDGSGTQVLIGTNVLTEDVGGQECALFQCPGAGGTGRSLRTGSWRIITRN